jgi:hypothetical protein
MTGPWGVRPPTTSAALSWSALAKTILLKTGGSKGLTERELIGLRLAERTGDSLISEAVRRSVERRRTWLDDLIAGAPTPASIPAPSDPWPSNPWPSNPSHSRTAASIPLPSKASVRAAVLSREHRFSTQVSRPRFSSRLDERAERWVVVAPHWTSTDAGFGELDATARSWTGAASVVFDWSLDVGAAPASSDESFTRSFGYDAQLIAAWDEYVGQAPDPYVVRARSAHAFWTTSSRIVSAVERYWTRRAHRRSTAFVMRSVIGRRIRKPSHASRTCATTATTEEPPLLSSSPTARNDGAENERAYELASAA